ncbi:hypothetical protein HDK64DRAFT_31383 [Phyllosticta capitalensis]
MLLAQFAFSFCWLPLHQWCLLTLFPNRLLHYRSTIISCLFTLFHSSIQPNATTTSFPLHSLFKTVALINNSSVLTFSQPLQIFPHRLRIARIQPACVPPSPERHSAPFHFNIFAQLARSPARPRTESCGRSLHPTFAVRCPRPRKLRAR